jgi:hypothetical protein
MKPTPTLFDRRKVATDHAWPGLSTRIYTKKTSTHLSAQPGLGDISLPRQNMALQIMMGGIIHIYMG